jgi:hypothetical protein
MMRVNSPVQASVEQARGLSGSRTKLKWITHEASVEHAPGFSGGCVGGCSSPGRRLTFSENPGKILGNSRPSRKKGARPRAGRAGEGPGRPANVCSNSGSALGPRPFRWRQPRHSARYRRGVQAGVDRAEEGWSYGMVCSSGKKCATKMTHCDF